MIRSTFALVLNVGELVGSVGDFVGCFEGLDVVGDWDGTELGCDVVGFTVGDFDGREVDGDFGVSVSENARVLM